MVYRSLVLAVLTLAACSDAPARPEAVTETTRATENAGGVSPAAMGDASALPAREAAGPESGALTRDETGPQQAVAIRLANDTGMTITRIDVHRCTEAGEASGPARDLLAGEPLAAGAEREVSLAAGCHYARPRYDDGSPNGLEIGEKILVRESRIHSFGLG